jgi:Spy/CpxP family protein refolding chaperone
MKSRTIGTIALGAVTVFAFTCAGLALAQGPGAGRGPGPQAAWQGDGPARGIEGLAARLDLSEEQVKAITEIQEQGRAKNQDLRKDMMRLQNELQGELLKDSPDAKAAAGLVAKIGELRTQLQQNRLEARLAVRQQLTPTQRDKMLLSGRGFGRGEGDGGRGPGRGHGRGPGFGRGDCRGRGGDCPRFDD